MVVQQTSLEAYTKLVQDRKLGINQKIILEVFDQVNGQYLSNMDLSIILGWSINRVTGRVKELRGMEYLMHCGFKTQLQTGKKVMLWCRPLDFKGFVEVIYNEK